MSNLQGWAYLESLLAEQFYKEFLMHKSKGQHCDCCKNEIDYIVTQYKGFGGEAVKKHRLCARHTDIAIKNCNERIIQEPVDQFKEYA